jgi:flagellum-specific peptidoglycan hydrolase FlgJ
MRIQIIGIIGSFIFLASSQASHSQTAYVKKWLPVAVHLEKDYGIPVPVILGIAIHESGSGTSRNAKLLNNHFGIKGKNNLLKEKGIRSAYRQYDNVEECYEHFCKVIKKKSFYRTLKGTRDHTAWINAISKAGYSVIPEIWKERVLSTIRKNRLASLSKIENERQELAGDK